MPTAMTGWTPFFGSGERPSALGLPGVLDEVDDQKLQFKRIARDGCRGLGELRADVRLARGGRAHAFDGLFRDGREVARALGGFLRLGVAPDAVDDARNLHRLAFNARKGRGDRGVLAGFLRKNEVEDRLEVENGAHRGLDFVGDHARHLIDDVATFKRSQSRAVFARERLGLLAALERFGKLARAALDEVLQDDVVADQG